MDEMYNIRQELNICLHRCIFTKSYYSKPNGYNLVPNLPKFVVEIKFFDGKIYFNLKT